MKVKTDFQASPTGYPFKTIDVGLPERTKRPCDLGYLRQTYINPKGNVSYRCASETEDVYLKKGGNPDITEGKKCLCNGLLAAIGMPQIKDIVEPPLITAGSDFSFLDRILTAGKEKYTAKDVVDYILGN